MNNLLADLLDRQTNPYQIHYYENINIYPDSSPTYPQVNTRMPQQPIPLRRTQGTQRTQGIQRTQRTQRTQETQGTQRTQGIQRTQGTHRTQGIQGIQRTQGINNANSYIETIEIEPIVTSVTFNPLETSMDSVFSQLTNSLLNLSQNRNQGVSVLNLNSKTELQMATDIDENCSICSSNYINNQIIRKINHCNHMFHQQCVDRWFATNSTCPICRVNLNSSPQEPREQPREQPNSEQLPVGSGEGEGEVEGQGEGDE